MATVCLRSDDLGSARPAGKPPPVTVAEPVMYSAQSGWLAVPTVFLAGTSAKLLIFQSFMPRRRTTR